MKSEAATERRLSLSNVPCFGPHFRLLIDHGPVVEAEPENRDRAWIHTSETPDRKLHESQKHGPLEQVIVAWNLLAWLLDPVLNLKWSSFLSACQAFANR